MEEDNSNVQFFEYDASFLEEEEQVCLQFEEEMLCFNFFDKSLNLEFLYVRLHWKKIMNIHPLAHLIIPIILMFFLPEIRMKVPLVMIVLQLEEVQLLLSTNPLNKKVRITGTRGKHDQGMEREEILSKLPSCLDFSIVGVQK